MKDTIVKGRKCEWLIRKAARALEAKDVARIWKWPEDKILQKQGKQCPHCGGAYESTNVLHAAKTGCDFFGFTKHGRVIMIECKESEQPRLTLNATSGLRIHQYCALRDCHKAGGIALICWLHGNEMATLDIGMMDELRENLRSLPWKKIPERFKIAITSKANPLLFLDPFVRFGCS